MLRFIVAYRWELWLLLWAPLLGSLASAFVFPLLGLLYDEGRLVPRHVLYAQGAAASLVHAGLLLVFYGRVRRLERRFLTLVWGYVLALAGIAALIGLSAAAFAPDDLADVLPLAFWSAGQSLALGIMALALLLWFAREASRLSLAHAYFLFLVTQTYALTGIVGSALINRVPVGLGFAMGFAFFIGAGFLSAWLLGNFESRDAIFRKRVVLLLLAVYLVPEIQGVVELVTHALGTDDWSFAALALALIGLLLALVGALPLALVYLIRVRQPEGGGRVQ